MPDRLLTDEQQAFFEDNGYLIVRNVVSADELETLRMAFDDVITDALDGGEARTKVRSAMDFKRPDNTVMTQLVQVHRAHPAFAQFIRHPAISRMAAELMHTTEVRLWHDQVLVKRPHDGGGVSWHQDYGYWQHAEPPAMVSSWTAIDKTTEENGCMHVIPGSHKWGLFKASIIDAFSHDIERFLKKSVPPEFQDKITHKAPYLMEPGDVAFHHCMTLHGSYANRTDQPRRGFVCHYLPKDTRYNAKKDPSKGHSHEIDVPDGAVINTDNFPLLYQAEA